jgi:hypothetical protein
VVFITTPLSRCCPEFVTQDLRTSILIIGSHSRNHSTMFFRIDGGRAKILRIAGDSDTFIILNTKDSRGDIRNRKTFLDLKSEHTQMQSLSLFGFIGKGKK